MLHTRVRKIGPDYPKNLLTFKNYNIEVENNTIKARSCIYIKDNIQYTRRGDQEGMENNVVILEMKSIIILNLYRPFANQNNKSPTE